MKSKYLLTAVGVAAALSLSGCSLFYPNPVPTPTPTATHTKTPKPTPTPTPTPTVDPSLKKVKINIIDSSAFIDNGYVEVVAEATDVLEDDGTCTVVFTQGKVSQTLTVKAVQNVSTTVCAAMQVPLSSFKATDISYTVTYKSSKSVGTSEPGTIQIQ